MSGQPSLFDFVKDLSYEKKGLFDPLTPGDFNVFMVNRAFSMYPDTIFFANEMNMLSKLSPQAVNDFYFYGLDKKKRFSKWAKAEKFDIITLIQEKYQCNINRAKEIKGLMNAENEKDLIKELDKGGVSKRSK